MNNQKHVPTKMKVMRGTYRKDRDSKSLVVNQVKEIPLPPKYFNSEQKQLWFDICDTLFCIGILQTIGVKTIEIYCQQYRIYSKAEESARDNPTVLSITKNGTIEKKNPAIDAMSASYAIMQGISDRFGFSPLSQSKIKEIGSVNGSNKDESDYNF